MGANPPSNKKPKRKDFRLIAVVGHPHLVGIALEGEERLAYLANEALEEEWKSIHHSLDRNASVVMDSN